MNDYFLAVIFGIVEGITEFLPVSSTAHLRIAQKLLGIPLEDEYWKMFAVIIQMGAILALVMYFRSRLRKLAESFIGEVGVGGILSHPISLILYAFVVTAIPAFLLTKLIGKNLESLRVIGASLLIGGVVMLLVDRFFAVSRVNDMNQMTWRESVWIGFAQIFSALFPGVSRSMSTIAGGQVVGLSRSTALEFSFFLSIPTMMAATGYETFRILFPKNSPMSLGDISLSASRLVVLGIGFIVSGMVAWVVIDWFLGWVRSRGFTPFAIYRIVIGIFVLYYA